jgi:hypothetical protein
VVASDIRAYEHPLVSDIAIRDLRAPSSLRGFNWAIANLRYQEQDTLGAHLVELGARDGCNVALLTRAEWIAAQARRKLIHSNPNFAGVVHLTSRPRWSEIHVASRPDTISFGLSYRLTQGCRELAGGRGSPIGPLIPPPPPT